MYEQTGMELPRRYYKDRNYNKSKKKYLMMV
jgi:hypothetical protein